MIFFCHSFLLQCYSYSIEHVLYYRIVSAHTHMITAVAVAFSLPLNSCTCFQTVLSGEVIHAITIDRNLRLYFLIGPENALVLVPSPPLQGMVSLVASPLSFFRLGEGSEGSRSGGLHKWPWAFCFWYALLSSLSLPQLDCGLLHRI